MQPAALPSEHPPRRYSMKRALDSCTKTVHQAINVIKPTLLHKRLCSELLEGCSEVNKKRDEYFELQADDRLVCEQQIASFDRKAAEVVELARENHRLSRCLDNLEKRKRIYRQAKTNLRRSVQPKDLIEKALNAAGTITLKDLKDFVTAIGQDTPDSVEAPHHVTLYAVDAISLLLREAMPAVKESPVVIYVAENEEDYFDENRSDSGLSDVSYLTQDTSLNIMEEDRLAQANMLAETRANTDEPSNIEDHASKTTDTHVRRALQSPEQSSSDPVAMAARKHREAVGLKVQTQRTQNQQSFLDSLNPDSSTKKDDSKTSIMEDNGPGSADSSSGEHFSSQSLDSARGMSQSIGAGLNYGVGADGTIDAEARVKSFPRSKRREVIAEIGKEEWLTLSWDKRLVHMHEFYPPGWQERENMRQKKVQREMRDADSVVSGESLNDRHKSEGAERPEMWPNELAWFQSTCEAGVATRESTNAVKRRFGLHPRVGNTTYPAGLLARSRHRTFCKSLTDVLALDSDVLVSLGSNAELLELLEPYMEMQRMSSSILDCGPCGDLGASLWTWLNCVLEFADAKPEHELLKARVETQRGLLARAQLLYDSAVSRRNACGERLRTIKFEIGRLQWLRNKSLHALANQRVACKERTKWPIRLRHHGDPPRFVVMVNQLSKINESLRVCIADFHEATRLQSRARAFEFEKRTARDECDRERRNVLNPWCWYMPDGMKWSGRCHNKWFVEGMRVAVGDDKKPGHIIRAWIHENGKGKRADVAYDEGGIVGEVPSYDLTMLYPEQVPFSRALEDSQDKFVSTTFETSSRTPILLNVAVIIPRLKSHWKFKSLQYEDARGDLFRADERRRVKAARVLQCFYGCIMHTYAMKKSRSWKSSERLRAFRSQNLIKFKKMQARNRVFAKRLLTRICAVTNMQRVVRGHLARTVFWDMLASIAEEERLRFENQEKRRQEIQIANQIRARAIQKQKVKSWRCPRCPLGVSFSQRFTDPTEIAAHMKSHEDADAILQQQALAEEAERDKLRRRQAMERLAKEKTALSKMRIIMENREIALNKARQERELRMKEKRIKKLSELFTIKYQRPILPSLRQRENLNSTGSKLLKRVDKGRGPVGIPDSGGTFNYALNKDGSPLFKRKALLPPFPELRLVRNALAKVGSAMLNQKGARSGPSTIKLPETISIICTPFRVGRSRFCDATLDSPEHPGLVSKDHAIIFVRGSASAGYTLVLADLHSTNGTFVDQVRVAPSSGTEFDSHNVELNDSALVVLGCKRHAESPTGLHLSSVCYQLWKRGSKF